MHSALALFIGCFSCKPPIHWKLVGHVELFRHEGTQRTKLDVLAFLKDVFYKFDHHELVHGKSLAWKMVWPRATAQKKVRRLWALSNFKGQTNEQIISTWNNHTQEFGSIKRLGARCFPNKHSPSEAQGLCHCKPSRWFQTWMNRGNAFLIAFRAWMRKCITSCIFFCLLKTALTFSR